MTLVRTAQRGGAVRRVGAALAGVLLVLLAGCSGQESSVRRDSSVPRTSDCVTEEPVSLTADIVRTLPHDADAYTQGLVLHDGALFESTGRYGESTVRELDPDTGTVLRTSDLGPDDFGEGLAVGRDGHLVQLTWKEGVAYERAADTFEVTRELPYDGEGWGLTTLGDGTLVMSDGSDTLVERDPSTFEVFDRRQVLRLDGDADLLNELEFDGEHLWANRYRTDEILRIDPECATVTGVLDVAGLRRDAAAAAGGDEIDVANGIAHLPGTDRYLLTGKWWPTMYEVTIEAG